MISLSSRHQYVDIRRNDYPLKEWIFVVGTYDGAIMKLYINGSLKRDRSIHMDINENQLPIFIGSMKKPPADTFHRDIDYVRIYNYALSEAEVEKLFNE